MKAPDSTQTEPREFAALTGYVPSNYSGASDAESGKGGERAEFVTLAEGVTLILGDCLRCERMAVDAVVTDPPYGMNYKSGPNSKNSISTTGKRYSETIGGDDKPFDPSPWVQWPCVMTGAHWFYSRLPDGGTIHTWDKRGPYESIDQADCDQIWSSRREPPRKLQCVWRGLCRTTEHTDPIVHPTQKPVMLMAWMMTRLAVPVGATVLDPYMGSGTTGIACIRTGRRFIGIERDPKHFETALQRLRAELAQGSLLFGGEGLEREGESASPVKPREGHNVRISD